MFFENKTMEEKMEKEKNKAVFLEGKKVNLRPVKEEDAEKFIQWVNDQEVTQYLIMFMPITLMQEKEWVKNVSCKDNELFLVIETKDGEAIGTTGFHQINWKDRNASHGIMIGNKKYWGGGFGTEAGMLLFNYAFQEFGLNKINSNLIGCCQILYLDCVSHCYQSTRSYNIRYICSRFKIVGRMRKQVFRKGSFHDQIFVDLFPKDFKKVWEKYISSK